MTRAKPDDTTKLLAAQQLEDDTRWLMDDPRGRRLVWRWLAEAGLFRTSYTGEAQSTAYNEGIRSRGLAMHAQVMQHAPERFLQMLAEAQEVSRAHTGQGGRQSPAA